MIGGWKRAPQYALSVLCLAAFMLALWPMATARADQLTDRKLTLLAGATDGASKPGGVVKHQFDFTVATTDSIGSIKFQYCTSASGTCTTPTGLVTTSATLDYENGATGFSLDNTTNGTPYLTRTAATINASSTVTYRLASVTNPTATNTAFYVRITTFGSTDTTGSPTDAGVVAAATANQIILTGIMPESLIFCTGATISTSGGVPDCATATSGNISFNQLFSPSDTATATSQMAASTNAGGGYNITVNGPTLTSGSNTIDAMASMAGGTRGTNQFGLNLRANTTTTSTPAKGTDVAPSSNGTNYRAQPLAGYSTIDNFKFGTGNSVADSSSGGLPSPSDSQIFTVTYIANVSGSLPAGTYSTTLTYICTPTF